MKREIIYCQTNEAWRRERAKSVGASAIGTILGLNRYRGPRQLAETMRKELRGIYDYGETMAQIRGHCYEGGVAKMFALFSGCEIIESSAREYLVRRDDMPWLHASPDRMAWIDAEGMKHGKTSEQNKLLVECKTTSKRVKRDPFNQSWWLQLQTQMGVTGYHNGVIVWDELRSNGEFGYSYFGYDDEVFGAIAAVSRDFWERVVMEGDDPATARQLMRRWPMLYAPVQGDNTQRPIYGLYDDGSEKARRVIGRQPRAMSAEVQAVITASGGTFELEEVESVDDNEENEVESCGLIGRLNKILKGR